MKKKMTIAILATPGVQLLDVSGPLDVFAEANVQTGTDFYELRVVGSALGAIRSSSGVRLLPDLVIGQKLTDKIDTLLVAGAPNLAEATFDSLVTNWLRQVAPKVRRYGSVCSGAFLLAKAGLLNGRRVATTGQSPIAWRKRIPR